MSSYYNLSDVELVSRIKSGDHDAFREIYLRYTGRLYSHAYLKLQDREEARDVVQDVLSSLWIRRESLDFQLNVPGYLYTSLRNRIINLINRKKHAESYLGSLSSFFQKGFAETDYLVRVNQLMQIVDQEIANMPPGMREVFELSRKMQLSHREIAEKLGISEKTVKNQVNGALKLLRVRLGIVNFLLFYFFL